MLPAAIGFFLFGCATNPFEKSQEELDNKIKIFNSRFDTKSSHLVPFLVHESVRENFIQNIREVESRITILESNVLNMVFYKKGIPAPKDTDPDAADFDELTITITYQISILPSNRLITKTHEQKWIKEPTGWYVIPNLQDFLS